ncbi:thymidylate synthase/dCMP hydroxymethylase domain-containing protein [Lipomyces tetrasporus]|uniref:thymidylate synthase n=1 Tax=Lipomyces tetrasporus TaxID=54092 RepID=A0AAD7VVH7_9ASCO|nr:thymidylate synthase/dCMP hydroxymethylase domain-containing protein [Lipomyces tetrasporus]KAJ8102984.1 thymidylate synthase/dCMP hydroxymethylase domain-containing protein [Lipomyces tetrasporus]
MNMSSSSSASSPLRNSEDELTTPPSSPPMSHFTSVSATTKPSRSANPEEESYLSLCAQILSTGEKRLDRTGTGTLSLFAPPQMRFSLRHNRFPLLTTKRVFLKGIVHELLWFVSGSTNAVDLAANGIHIWDGNGSREYLDSVGLSHREVGDLGPVYGFQWRHFGAEYVDAKTDYNGKGVDQLRDLIWKIKNKPYDRRLILTAWNPADAQKMALPPCHMFAQFYVSYPNGPDGQGELSCCLYQRSADMGLGVPFNIASYALLTVMVATVCGLKPGEFVHCLGDAHVYLDHVDAMKTQVDRVPREFPKLFVKRDVTDIDDFRFEDFEVVGYNPHGKIQMKMSV